MNRIADGGRVVAPDLGDYGIQVIDGRDQARWMLELLEPYRGHRFRLIRLLLASGRLRLGRAVAL